MFNVGSGSFQLIWFSMMFFYLSSVVHTFFLVSSCYSCRNVTFHYRRSSAAYFGGTCSMSRGVGVNEVRSAVLTSVVTACDCEWIISRSLLCVSTVRHHRVHGRVSVPEPGAESGHPVGPSIQEKYTWNRHSYLDITSQGGEGGGSVQSQNNKVQVLHIPQKIPMGPWLGNARLSPRSTVVEWTLVLY